MVRVEESGKILRGSNAWTGRVRRGAQNPAFDAFYRKESLLLSTE